MARKIWLIRVREGVGPKQCHGMPKMLMDIMETDGDPPILGWVENGGRMVPGGNAYVLYEAIPAKNPDALHDGAGNRLCQCLLDYVNDAGEIATDAMGPVDMTKRAWRTIPQLITPDNPTGAPIVRLEHDGAALEPFKGRNTHLGEIG